MDRSVCLSRCVLYDHLASLSVCLSVGLSVCPFICGGRVREGEGMHEVVGRRREGGEVRE